MAERWLKGGGSAGALMRSRDWSGSPLGEPGSWPQSLRSAVGLMLGSKFPMFVAWGPQLRLLYNDAYAEILGAKHPEAMGAPFGVVWAEIWPDVRPLVETALAGEATFGEDVPLTMNRYGYDEQTWFTFSYSPVRDESGEVAGMFCACVETSERVRAREREAFLARLDDRLRDLDDAVSILAASTALLGELMKADRVHWAMVDDGSGSFEVRQEWTAPGVASLIGRHRLTDFGEPLIAQMRAGETVAVEDVAADGRTAPDAPDRIGGDVRGALSIPLFRENAWQAALCVHTLAPRRWRPDERDLIRDVAVRTWSWAERARVLYESAQRVQLATEAAEVGFWDLDPREDVLIWPPRVKRMFGISPDVPVSMADFYTGLHPDDRERVTAAFARALDPEARAVYDVEYRTIGKEDGVLRWVAAKGRGIFDERGECVRVIGTAVDVTVRKTAEEHLRLMVNELNHRVKNSLATVQAITTQTLRHGEIPTEVRDALTSRLLALAKAHDVLTDERWSGADLADLARQAAAPYDGLRGGSAFVIDGPSVFLPPKTAIALALAFHELATNAAKYGALSRAEGQVRLTWSVAQAPGGRRLTLSWRESGGPPVAAPASTGFGTRLIQRALASELQGSVRLDFWPLGLNCAMEALLPDEPAEAWKIDLQLA